jgi:KTSC domain
MPGSAGDPKPPDAAQKYFSRKLRQALAAQGLGSGRGAPYSTQSRRIDPATGGPSVEKQAIAADPSWDRFTDKRGLGVSPADVLGAADLIGDEWQKSAKRPGGGFDPSEILTDLTIGDPDYEVVSWTDPWGTVPVKYSTTLGDYFANESTTYLENEGFYTGVGYGYAVNPSADPDMGRAPTVAEASSVGKWPADITMAPTATKHPERPRTVAAGYDSKRKVLTVIFRDGTFYNYYGVSSLEWGNFGRDRSKGEHINKYLNGKVRGAADVGSVPMAHRELLYKIARTSQVRYTGLQKGHSPTSARGKPGSRGAPGSSASGGRSYRKGKSAAAAASVATPPPGSSRYIGGPT